MVAGGFSRWFVEVTGEIKVQTPAHTAVSEVQTLLLVTKAWHCAGGTRAVCSWRGGCRAADGHSWLLAGSVATLSPGPKLSSSRRDQFALLPVLCCSPRLQRCPGSRGGVLVPRSPGAVVGSPALPCSSALGAARRSLLSTTSAFVSAVLILWPSPCHSLGSPLPLQLLDPPVGSR